MTNEINNSLNEIVDKLNSLPDLFMLNKQNCADVQAYFKTNFNCQHLPQEFLEFMQNLDGLQTETFTIFSLNDNDKENFVMKFEDYSTEKDVQNYCSNLKKKTKSKLFFFGCDNLGGRFAFKTNNKDNSVYYLNRSKPNQILIYNSFLGLLNDQIEEFINRKI